MSNLREKSTQTLLKSIGLLNASIDTGKSAVETTDKAIKVVGNTAENADKIATAATDLTVKSTEATGKIVDAIGDNSDKLITSGSDAAVASMTSLTNQLTNTNEITTTLMKTTNESLKRTSEPISIIIGDVFKSSAGILGGVLVALTAPFKGIKDKIETIQKNKDLPTVKFNNIKKAYEYSYNATSKELQNRFIRQIETMINNAQNLLKLYKKLGCKKNFVSGYNCDEQIQTKINEIEKLYPFMKIDKDTFKSKLESKFNEFLPFLNSNQPEGLTNSLNDEQLNVIITTFGEKIITKQNEIVTTAINLLSDTLEKFNTGYILRITNEIEQLKGSLLNTVNNSNHPTGGRKIQKSRQTKRNKKSKKSKTRRSK